MLAIVLATLLLSASAIPIGNFSKHHEGDLLEVFERSVPNTAVLRERTHQPVMEFQRYSEGSGSFNASDLRSGLFRRTQSSSSSPMSITLMTDRNKLIRYGIMRIGDSISTSTPSANKLKLSSTDSYQVLPLAFDTASVMSIVPGPGCREGCIDHAYYDPTKSQTAKVWSQSFDTTKAREGLGGGKGSKLVEDNAYVETFGEAPTAVRHAFGLAEEYSDSLSTQKLFNPAGIMSMAYYKAVKDTKDVRSLPIELWRSGASDSPHFTFLPLEISSDSREVAQIIFGKYGNPPANTIIPVIPNNKALWKLMCKAILMDEQALVATPTEAIISTGDPFIHLPSKAVASLYKGVSTLNPGLVRTDADGRWHVPCNGKYPKLTAGFGEIGLDLKPEWFAIPTGEEDNCIGAVLASKTSKIKIGDSLLRRYTVQFDPEKGTIAFGSPRGST